MPYLTDLYVLGELCNYATTEENGGIVGYNKNVLNAINSFISISTKCKLKLELIGCNSAVIRPRAVVLSFTQREWCQQMDA